eukprot:SAG31_NODE_20533_length_572_cov_0.651163_1_plen_21_part_10
MDRSYGLYVNIFTVRRSHTNY